MKNIIKKSAVTLMALAVLGSVVDAKECFNTDKIDVTWTSYKTLAKIGVGGNFSKVDLKVANKDAVDVKKMLLDAEITTSLEVLDANMDVKNINIAKFFTANIDDKTVVAKVVSGTDNKLGVSITLNKVTQTIPMSYTVEEGKIKAIGVIDGLDYKLVPALGILNMNVGGHKKKGWNDIRIGFELSFASGCSK